ncbi:unnamed protein product [Miscanthus lutarioriparius]|uniref:No apical meristem-associated C-terminal domain-containing protein n=1 Tax=Miscanthus lutarioriparius TaxID=422564 RepID=A0A811QEX7_9POAL|nr:unnamed protein product [Miscanthus lutarioriparius]
MEGSDLPPGNMLQGVPYDTLDLRGSSMQKHAPNSGKQIFSSSQMPGTFTMSMTRATEPDDFPGFQFKEHGKSDDHHHQHHSHHSKNFKSDGEEHDVAEDATDTPSGKGKKGSAWHRMKWTDSMVKLLITAVSYTGDDHGADSGGGRRNFTIMQKKGKWKAISKHSLLLALRCKEEHDPRRDPSGDADEDDQSADSDYEENDEEQHPVHTNMWEPSTHKRKRHSDVALVTSSSHEGSERSDPHGVTVDINKAFTDATNMVLLQQDLASQAIEIQKRRLQIEAKELELTKQRLKWERFRKKKDREIEKMALENDHMMIENKRLELELRHKELELDLKLKGQGNHP